MTQLVKNPPAMWETWVRSLGWEDPLEKGKATHSSVLVWRIPWTVYPWGFPGGSAGKESTSNAGDAGDADLIPELRRSPGGGHGSPLQNSCLENPMDRSALQATELGRTERLSLMVA